MPPKSGHQRAKNIGYDDDGMYSEEEEYYEEAGEGQGDAMTDEDKAQMESATTAVKETLDGSLNITDAQIQEALWHYYYDVGKSVTYLKSTIFTRRARRWPAADSPLDKHTPKAPSQPKQSQKATSRFDQAASAAGEGAPTGKQTLCHVQSTTVCAALGLIPLSSDHLSAKTSDFFWDTPWGGIAQHRLGVIVEPPRPRGGLLGGSKLAALAARRKQKQEEEALKADETDKAVELLDRLSVKSDLPTPSAPSVEPTTQSVRYQRTRSRNRSRSPRASTPEPEEDSAPEPAKPLIEFPNLRAQPSMFATTLCSTSFSAEPAAEPGAVSMFSSFALPHTTVSGARYVDPFVDPSPDDIVREAQKRGARRH
jgi:elongation factor 1 alpha-like protein